MSERQRSMHRLEKPDLMATQPRRRVERPTADNPLILSASELSDFLRCRVKHHWGYQCQLAPAAKSIPLAMGTLGHEIMEDFYALDYAKRTPKAMKRVARARIKDTTLKQLTTEDRDLLQAMTIGYAEWCMNEEADNNDKVIGLRECVPEEWFDLPLTKDRSIRVRGKLDVRFTSHAYKSTMGILESKFKAQIRYDDVENRLQLSVYLWALRRKYPKLKRYIAYYQILRKQMPGPRVKADLFFREGVERDAEEVEQWAKDAAHAAADMLDGAVYPSPMDSCSWSCDFKVPCLLRGNKEDLLHVLSTNYTTREKAK